MNEAPLGMPPELAERFAECKTGLERALRDQAHVKAEGGDLEADMAQWRHMLSTNEVMRAACTLVWIGDRYASIVEPKHLVTAAYPEEAMWTNPPMWRPDSPVLGHEDELLTPHKSRREWQVLGSTNEPVLTRLRAVLDGLDLLPAATRSRFVNEWALVRLGNEAYRVRTDGHVTVTQPHEYRFISLALPGPLNGAEAELVGSLLRAYCGVAHSRTHKVTKNEHPYQALRRQHDAHCAWQAAELVSYWTEKQKELDVEWRRVQRDMRVARKREILASGLGFQDELAKLLSASGYQCQTFKTKDRGIDLLTQKGAGGVRIGIQAKKLKKPVGAGEVRALRGAREVNRLDVVALVSASDFTRDARKEARIQPAVHLVSLEDLLERQDLGQDPLFIRRT